MNIIPIFALIWLVGQYQLGLLGVREGTESLIPLAVLLIIAAVLLLAATWIVLPTLRWARKWSAWHIDEPEGTTWMGMVALPVAYVVSAGTWLLFILVTVMLGFTIYRSFLAAQPVIKENIDQGMEQLP